MQAVAALVTRCSYDQNVSLGAFLHGIREQRMGRAGWGQFASADVDDVCARLDGLTDRAGQIEL
jgi:hypothetical protein